MRVKRVGALLMVTAAIAMGAVVGCGGGSGSSDGTNAGLPASPEGKAEAANFNGVHSGEVELVLQVKRFKKEPEAIKMRILGTFKRVEKEVLPRLDLAIESNGELAGRNVEFLSGPLLRAERWIVNFDGKVYEPDHASFEDLKSKVEEAQKEEGGEGNAMACVEAAEGSSLSDVARRVSFEGRGEALDGTKVETVGADLDVTAAIEELIKLSEESPGCRAQLEAVGVPPGPQLEELEKQLKGSLTAARLILSIDKNGIVRYFSVLANVELPHNEELEVEAYMRLNRVNEVTEVPYARGYSPYPALLKRFGLTPQDVKQADGDEIYLGVLEVLANRLFGRETG